MEHTFRSSRMPALVSGWSLIFMAVMAGYAFGFVFNRLYMAGDATATLQQMVAGPGLLASFLFSFAVILLLDLAAAWGLYRFFQPAHALLARWSGWLRVAYTALAGWALIPLYNVLVMTNLQEQAVMHGFEMFMERWSISLVVFGGHLLATGLAARHSAAVPKFVVALLLFAGVCYIATNSASLLLPGYAACRNTVEAILGLPMALGELALAVWLIWKGGRD